MRAHRLRAQLPGDHASSCLLPSVSPPLEMCPAENRCLGAAASPTGQALRVQRRSWGQAAALSCMVPCERLRGWARLRLRGHLGIPELEEKALAQGLTADLWPSAPRWASRHSGRTAGFSDALSVPRGPTAKVSPSPCRPLCPCSLLQEALLHLPK